MLIIDGNTFNIPVLEVRRRCEFLDKSASRTASGVLKRKLIGVYFNYTLSLGSGTNKQEYYSLYEKLSEPVEFHEVEVPYGNEKLTFTAYFADVEDSLLRLKNGDAIWTGLTVSFIAKEPAKAPNL